jgi:hypothetical protein
MYVSFYGKGKSLNTLETMDVPQASWIASSNETI